MNGMKEKSGIGGENRKSEENSKGENNRKGEENHKSEEKHRTALELDNITAGYGREPVLKGISLSLRKGERMAVLGRNGSGKTTLLRVIAGLLPFSGTARICGRDVRGLKREELAKRVAMMSQFAGASLPYTVEETVRMGRYVHRPAGLFSGMLSGTDERDRKAVDACLRAAGLEEKRDRMVTELSGGQLQRVFLARALAQEPSLMLLDEPTSHMDLKYQTELVDYLKGWGEENGHAVVGVLHDISLALRLADVFCFLKDGTVLACGDASVITPQLLEETYEMDVAAWMRESAGRLEEILDGKDLPKS
ncbi:MAG TPA: ABC transporter ATP-binding protein [Candidatus Eisenbergiella merdipullorum]|uniref:ABC transporter ATP-binding protein n=1 Tax=Candidatus Eisenbergiella merdipullorum TaxID=2838553 RepID=A0A9D2KZP9_9FIRM|nr:ABC transporter ATP-binding protein [Candidatus Eisenbergiella merdipullorum]